MADGAAAISRAAKGASKKIGLKRCIMAPQ
jgi:hypothetical protein